MYRKHDLKLLVYEHDLKLLVYEHVLKHDLKLLVYEHDLKLLVYEHVLKLLVCMCMTLSMSSLWGPQSVGSPIY